MCRTLREEKFGNQIRCSLRNPAVLSNPFDSQGNGVISREVTACPDTDYSEAGFSAPALAGFDVCGRHSSRCLGREKGLAALGGNEATSADLNATKRSVFQRRTNGCSSDAE